MKASEKLAPGIRFSTLRGTLRLAGLLIAAFLWLCLCTPAILIAALLGKQARYRMVMMLTGPFCRTMAMLMGIRVTIEGKPAPNVLIFVANHVSWTDILLVGMSVRGMFVSRHDVKDWPLIGLFARLAGTVFIDRSSLRSATESSRSIVERTREGVRVAFFPEGGATAGDEVVSFKPFLFGGIVEEGCTVQPVTLRYTHIGTAPLTPENRDLIYWYKPDQDFVAQGWELLKLPSVRATVTFRTPLAPPENPNRDTLRSFVEELRQRTGEGVPVWNR